MPVTKEHVANMTRDAHIDMYRMFCSACIVNEDDGRVEQAQDNRKIMNELLTYGKITPEEAVDIEAEMRVTLPQLQAAMTLVAETFLTPATRH